MKGMLTLAVLTLPSGVLTACEHGAKTCGGGHCGGHLGTVLLAATAALGYWVLRSSEKDAGAVRWGGRVAGWVLLVVGLLGFLCGSLSHIKGAGEKRSCHHGESGYGHSSGMMEMPPGHPPIEGKKVR